MMCECSHHTCDMWRSEDNFWVFLDSLEAVSLVSAALCTPGQLVRECVGNSPVSTSLLTIRMLRFQMPTIPSSFCSFMWVLGIDLHVRLVQQVLLLNCCTSPVLMNLMSILSCFCFGHPKIVQFWVLFFNGKSTVTATVLLLIWVFSYICTDISTYYMWFDWCSFI